MSPSEKLAEMFQMLPNIGPRQARRFVNYILSKNNGYGSELARLIKEIKSHYAVCSLCGKYFEKTGTRDVCRICADRGRDRSLMMTVANGADLDQIERSGAWLGLYFIIGGPVPILSNNIDSLLNIQSLCGRIEREAASLKEIVIGMDITSEGEYTEKIIADRIKPTCEKHGIKLSTLGRGLSTGTEIEYADSETFKQALRHRE